MRGITQPDGTAEFCEVFFTDARCPNANVVGGVNNGWKVANSTLAFERGQSATTGYRRFEEEYRLIVDEARANGVDRRRRRSASASPATTPRSRSCASTACARCRRTLPGTKDPSIAALGAPNKMFWSEMHQRAMELALDIFGAARDARRRRTGVRLVAGHPARRSARRLSRVGR